MSIAESKSTSMGATLGGRVEEPDTWEKVGEREPPSSARSIDASSNPGIESSVWRCVGVGVEVVIGEACGNWAKVVVVVEAIVAVGVVEAATILSSSTCISRSTLPRRRVTEGPVGVAEAVVMVVELVLAEGVVGEVMKVVLWDLKRSMS